ncbi:MAG: VanZ family protein [Deltaproteobacteria bacterium]|nr:VanZ family protein [Deltaproteobacteria bacterium]
MGRKRLTTRAAYRRALLESVHYALADEIHQSLVPHRASDIWDFAADCAGALLGSLLYRLLALRQRPSPSTSAAPARPR